MTSNISILEEKNPLRIALAYGVHLFIATRAVWGFLALLAVFDHDWRMMIFWMIASVLVDSLDGMLASAYQFTQADAKTDDHYFKGFPSYWNLVVVYLLVMGLDPWINFVLLMTLTVLVFVPVKYIYPSRNTYLRRLTLGLTYLYGVVSIWGVIQYPNVPRWTVWAWLLYVVYYTVISLITKAHVGRHAN